ncbi:MAG: SDR family NAD(P)-dependent oxidoreductase [Wenzhouxiangellaceae bacterium]
MNSTATVNRPLAAADWSGCHLLITGAAGSLGAALARRAARMGAALVLLDKDRRGLGQLADELEAGGCEPFLLPLDLAGATPDDYDRFADALSEHIGALDAVLHCAAHFDGLMPLAQIPPTQWWLSIQANLTAPLLLSRICTDLLRERQGVNLLLLDQPETMAEAFWGAYGVAQWGLHGLVQQLARECSNLPMLVRGLVLPPFQSGMRARAFPAERPDSLPPPESLAAAICEYLRSCENAAIISEIDAGSREN